MAKDHKNRPRITIRVIAFIELSLGLVTLCGMASYHVFALERKPLNVLIFVLASSILSTIIGCGILMRREWSRVLLIFFSGYVVITKIMIFSNLLELKGQIVTAIPVGLKDLTSYAYHLFLILLLTRKRFRDEFTQN